MVKLALGFVLGVYSLQQQSALPNLTGLGVLLLAAALSIFLLQRYQQSAKQWQLVRSFTLFTLACLCGFSWAALQAQHRLSETLPAAWEGEDITLMGVVATLPKLNDRGERFTFDVEQVLTKGVAVPQHINLSFYPYRFNSNERIAPEHISFKVGQRWQVTVRLKQPHGSYNPHGFDYEAWILSQSIRATGYISLKSPIEKRADFVWHPQYMVHHVRALVGERIDKVLQGSNYAGVIRALVIGDESQINQQQWQTYLATGTNHLMSISGLHITMLAGFAYAIINGLWRRFPRLVYALPAQKAATIAGMLVAILYAALAGFSVPTQRTLYMLITVAMMLLLGRRIAFPTILSIALLVVVLIDPWAVLGAGFWLSFGAVASIVYATSGRFAASHWLYTATKTQWAVTLALIPALVVMFGQFSLISPVANALAIPLLSFTVVPPAILGSLFDIDLLIRFAHLMLDTCMTGLIWLTEVPIVIWQQQAPHSWTVYIAMIGIVWHLLPRGLPFRYMALLCVLPMMLLKPSALPKGQYKVTVLDVGQGLSVVVETTSHRLLYDAGAKYSSERDAGTNMIVPFLQGEGIKHLDMAVLSHDDLDHVGGFASVLRTIPVDQLISSLASDAHLFHTQMYQAHQPASHQACTTGLNWQWDGVDFAILSPNQQALNDSQLKDNDKSCVLKISSENGAILLTGDIEKHTEYWLLANDESVLSSDVLIAPHHGSKTSSTVDFVKAVDPAAVVFASGYRNRFGHPKPTIVQRYQAHDASVYRTDLDGAVQILFDYDDTLNIDTWRNAEPRYWHAESLK